MPPPRLHPLPKAGAVILKDFRIEDASSLAPRVGQGETKPLKILQWNIERGYKLEGIIAELKKVDADVLALQEIDVGCARSDWEDTGERIAKELRMNYAFVCEFEELYSPLRSARSQGGGVHGNAILSRFDMSNVEAIEHRHQPVDWDDDAVSTALQEPRRGRRLSLVADVHTPQGTLVVFSAHLEVFTGIIGRLHQFSDLLRCSKERLSRGLSCQAIMGDLNTLGHGIARISPQHCNDSLRWRTLGYSEGQFWVDHVLSVRDPLHGRDVEDGGGSGSGKGAAPAGDGALPPRAQSLGRSKWLLGEAPSERARPRPRRRVPQRGVQQLCQQAAARSRAAGGGLQGPPEPGIRGPVRPRDADAGAGIHEAVGLPADERQAGLDAAPARRRRVERARQPRLLPLGPQVARGYHRAAAEEQLTSGAPCGGREMLEIGLPKAGADGPCYMHLGPSPKDV
eukprot:CAMPEP_0177619136 /NCGR_PEP_ID=MMETSP0419_2-20121207/26069_1 /TAXON_ID=582737 /ORGANISM="Tetraselmis sp., Strain GSL018" /LENGTH=454 /DNA_ID=CAMNT_0019118323 /DNA_START=325 /DNA_END=1690 /DNA_ORIENTATION=-